MQLKEEGLRTKFLSTQPVHEFEDDDDAASVSSSMDAELEEPQDKFQLIVLDICVVIVILMIGGLTTVMILSYAGWKRADTSQSVKLGPEPLLRRSKDFFYPFNKPSQWPPGQHSMYTGPGKVVPLILKDHWNTSEWPYVLDDQGWLEVSDGFAVKCRFLKDASVKRYCLLLCFSSIERGLLPMNCWPDSTGKVCFMNVSLGQGEVSNSAIIAHGDVWVALHAPPVEARTFTLWENYQLIPDLDTKRVILRAPGRGMSDGLRLEKCWSWCAIYSKCIGAQLLADSPLQVTVPGEVNEETFTCTLFLQGQGSTKFTYRRYNGMMSVLTTTDHIISPPI